MTIIQESRNMPLETQPAYLGKLSPSANAVLGVLRALEEGGELDLFQEDPELQRLRVIVSSFRGGLYSVLVKRLNQVVNLGGVSVITQRDMVSLLEEIWANNVSKLSDTDLVVLKGTLENPTFSMSELSASSDISYAQVRRGSLRLRESEVLEIKGLLNMPKLGLERILITLEAPSMILSGPFVRSQLFVDSDGPHVYQVLTIPKANMGELRNVVRNLHATSRNVKSWKLSRGNPQFNGLYYSGKKTGKWHVDMMHFRLMLRTGGEELTIGDYAARTLIPSVNFTESELTILEYLLDNYEMTAQEIVEATKLSHSTAFRKRASLINENIVEPRVKVNIPALSDRVIALTSPDVAGNILPAWKQLPLSYIALIENTENKSEKKVLFTSALPAGHGHKLIQVINEETSKVDEIVAYPIAGGSDSKFKVSSLYDRNKSAWKWSLGFFDLLSYSVGRRDAETGTGIPIDLA